MYCILETNNKIKLVKKEFSGGNNYRHGRNRELELEVEPEDMTKLPQSHDKTSTDNELLLMHEQRK